MQNLNNQIKIMKENLEMKNLKNIKSSKFKTISTKDIKNEESIIKEYNYYTKLTKRIKKYINSKDEIIFETYEDNEGRIVGLFIKFDLNKMEIFMPIDIRVITGNTKDTFMDCTYYNLEKEGKIYIKEFSSGKPRCGYGKLILSNLDNIVKSINLKFDTYNHYSKDYKFNYISKIEGVAIPTKTIISQKELNKLYRRYGFIIDEKNNMSMLKIIDNI